MNGIKTSSLKGLFTSCLLLAVMHSPLLAWGDEGHYWVTRHALKALPQGLQDEFSDGVRDLVDFSILADLRKAEDPDEAPRHYLNLDAYGAYPFPGFTLRREIMEKKWGKQVVRRNGTLLWDIDSTYQRLLDAFSRGDTKEIVAMAADLSHYVADLHQPFHSTQNYNGQLTDQQGIHFRFESDLFQRFREKVVYRPRRLARLEAVAGQSLSWLKKSFTLVEPILEAEASIVSRLKIDRQRYQGEDRRAFAYPDEYYRKLWLATGPLMERRLNDAVWAVASLWWTAWQEAGR